MKKLSDYKNLNFIQRWIVDYFPLYAPASWIERRGAEIAKKELDDEGFENLIKELKDNTKKLINENENKGNHRTDSSNY